MTTNKSVREWDAFKEREKVSTYFEQVSKYSYDFERSEVLNKLLSSYGNLFVDHLSSEQFAKKIKPNKSGFLSEQIHICKTLDKLANTLLFASMQTGKNMDKYYPVEKDITKARRYKRSESYVEGSDNSKNESGDGEIDSKLKAKKLPRTFDCEHGLKFNVDVDASDLTWTTWDEKWMKADLSLSYSESKFPYFVYDQLSRVQQIEPRTTTEVKMKKNIIDMHQIRNELRKLPSSKPLTKWRSELTQDMISTKESMKSYIRFKKISNESNYVDFDRVTWYEHNGEYCVVSDNVIRLSDPNHIYGIIKSYEEISLRNDTKHDSELMHLFSCLDELILSTDLDDVELRIIELLKQDRKRSDIAELVNTEFDREFSSKQIERMLRRYIPQKIADTYVKSKEDWLFEHKITGRYIVCTKCGVPKPATSRYFGMNLDKDEGIKEICRKCEK